MKKTTVAAFGLAIAMATAGVGLAAGTADDMINTRQAEMKTNMQAMKLLVSMIKGETPFDVAGVHAAAKSIKDAAADSQAKGAWDASTQTGATVKSGAKPDIWTDPAGFTAAWSALDAAVVTLAATTDEASLKAAFPALGGACKGCHEKYRASE